MFLQGTIFCLQMLYLIAEPQPEGLCSIPEHSQSLGVLLW